MRASQRGDAVANGGEARIPRHANDSLNDGEQILRPVVDFAGEQRTMRFRAPPGVHVHDDANPLGDPARLAQRIGRIANGYGAGAAPSPLPVRRRDAELRTEWPPGRDRDQPGIASELPIIIVQRRHPADFGSGHIRFGLAGDPPRTPVPPKRERPTG